MRQLICQLSCREECTWVQLRSLTNVSESTSSNSNKYTHSSFQVRGWVMSRVVEASRVHCWLWFRIDLRDEFAISCFGCGWFKAVGYAVPIRIASDWTRQRPDNLSMLPMTWWNTLDLDLKSLLKASAQDLLRPLRQIKLNFSNNSSQWKLWSFQRMCGKAPDFVGLDVSLGRSGW